ncbi:MAG: carboxypeptidase regulatory-like domain-containing protein [Luteitalea sp.]
MGVLVLALAMPALAWAQGSTSTVRGTVSDASGGILPGASVTMTNQGTKDARTAVTDDRGGYLFSGLFPGSYSVKVELQGFKTYEQTNLVLSPNDTRGVDMSLEVGALSEVVSVTSSREYIQTETGAREGVLNAEQIDKLSIIGRSSLELLRILPGVVAPDQSQLESVGFGTGANNTQGYTVNGIRSSGNTVSLDGSSLIDIGSNSGVIVTLNNDMVQEVKVQSSNYASEYGSSGMSVSAVTKAGTSRYRGTLYDYIRDYRFGANDRSNSIAGVEKPKSTFQYPGGNIGGPIVIPGLDFTRNRDKLFFFLGYEYQYQKVDSGTRFTSVPTPAMKRGDFSELLAGTGQNLNMPQVVNLPGGVTGAGTPAPGNNVSPFIHPLGQYLVNLYPDPNHVDPTNRFNYVYSALEPQNRNDLKVRLDYNISNNTKAYVRVAQESEKYDQPRGGWWGPSQVALPTPNVADSGGRSYSFNLVNVLGPTTTSEALVSYSRLKLDHFYKDPSRIRKDSVGIDFEGMFPGESPYLPLQTIHSWGGSQVGDLWSPTNDVFAYNDALQLSYKLTKIVGAHGLKFGTSATRLTKEQNFQNEENVQLIYANWAPGSTGNTVADMLIGKFAQADQGTRIPVGNFRAWNFDVFAQDSWKVRSNVTLEYGMRMGYMPNNIEVNGLGGVFNPALYDPNAGTFLDPGTFQRINGYQYASTGDVPLSLVPNRDPFWMPRVNLAWNIDGEGNNVLRGGYGLFVNRPMGNVEYDTTLRIAPNAYRTSASAGDFASLAGGAGLNYDTLRLVNGYQRAGSGAYSVSTPSLESSDNTWPTTHSFSVSYARRIPFGQVLETAYVGTRGRDLVSRRDSNAIPLGGLLNGGVIGNANLADPVHRVAAATTVVNQFRPYRAFSGVTTFEFQGESNYNSLQVTLSRQSSSRLSYFATYTLSRNEGTLGGEYSTRDPIDPNRTYGILESDRTHIFNLSWNAVLPDPVQGGNPILGAVLNGWQLSGISTVASGIPIRLRFTGDLNSSGIARAVFGTPSFVGGQGSGPFAPIFVSDPRLSTNKVGEKLFDINSIRIPDLAAGELGEFTPSYNLRYPTRMTHDLTIFKDFRLGGDQRLQFRAGFFNLFNMAYVGTRPDLGNDFDLTLETRCLARVNGVPNGTGGTVNNVCDPFGGFEFTPNTIANFGKINLKRGRRVVEFALKYYF